MRVTEILKTLNSAEADYKLNSDLEALAMTLRSAKSELNQVSGFGRLEKEFKTAAIRFNQLLDVVCAAQIDKGVEYLTLSDCNHFE
ncbi:hypothetical protein JXA85_05045 [Candidatus Woesearchaeota archaeon]|nr:hypothetical protein [Candidatus Woesearchaeota archaeon]